MSIKIDPTTRYSIKAIRRMNKKPPQNSSYLSKKIYNEPDLRIMLKALDKMSETLKTLRYFV